MLQPQKQRALTGSASPADARCHTQPPLHIQASCSVSRLCDYTGQPILCAASSGWLRKKKRSAVEVIYSGLCLSVAVKLSLACSYLSVLRELCWGFCFSNRGLQQNTKHHIEDGGWSGALLSNGQSIGALWGAFSYCLCKNNTGKPVKWGQRFFSPHLRDHMYE